MGAGGATAFLRRSPPVEHVPSLLASRLDASLVTTFPGKPTVDVLAVIAGISAENGRAAPRLAAGYGCRMRGPDHRMLRTPELDAHVRIFERGDPAISEYLPFQDLLRTSAADREQYERAAPT